MKKTVEQFIHESWCKHGDRYNYKLVDYIKSSIKVKIICPIHGVFEQRPNNHLQGQGCKQCDSNKKHCKMVSVIDDFIHKSINTHNNKYDYSLVEYVNARTKVKIICPIHGVFIQTPVSHTRGRGCKQCALLKRKINRYNTRYNNDVFIHESWCKHGDRYNYKLVDYIKSSIKVKIICPIHGVFEQRPNNHLQGQGCPKCPVQYHISKQEQELQNFLKQHIDIECNDRSIISPYELDIVIPSKNIAIEYNGLYWHSEQRGKDRNYHLNKYNMCKDKGYRLIQIFEDEWLTKQDIVKSRLKHILGFRDRTVFARKCTIREIVPNVARDFINKYHIQGYHGCNVKLGLFYNDELVSVMTFAKPSISKGRSNKEDVFELSRFCSSCAVTGAAGKLLKYFTRNYIVKELYTYADLRWSDGNLYKQLGFIEGKQTPPNFWWNINGIRKHRFGYRKDVLNKRLDSFDPDITGYQNMINNGYDRVWDCGNLKYHKLRRYTK